MPDDLRPTDVNHPGDEAKLPDVEWLAATAAFGWLGLGNAAAISDIMYQLSVERPISEELNGQLAALSRGCDFVMPAIRSGKLPTFVEQRDSATPTLVHPSIFSQGTEIGNLSVHCLQGKITREYSDFDAGDQTNYRLDESDKAFARARKAGLTDGRVLFRRSDLARVFCGMASEQDVRPSVNRPSDVRRPADDIIENDERAVQVEPATAKRKPPPINGIECPYTRGDFETARDRLPLMITWGKWRYGTGRIPGRPSLLADHRADFGKIPGISDDSDKRLIRDLKAALDPNNHGGAPAHRAADFIWEEFPSSQVHPK